MKTKILCICIIIPTIISLLPLIHAAGYGCGPYGANPYGNSTCPAYCGDGICNNQETSSSCSQDCGNGEGGNSGSGGGGGGTSGEYNLTNVSSIRILCRKDSECKKNQYCLNKTCVGKECLDDSTCDAKEREVCFNYKCTRMPNIEIVKYLSPLKKNQTFDFIYLVRSDANMDGNFLITFWIEKNKKKNVFGNSSIYLKKYEEKVATGSLTLPKDIATGNYKFYMQMTYPNNVLEDFKEIKIIENEETPEALPRLSYIFYIFIPLILLFLLIILILLFLKRRKDKEEEKDSDEDKNKDEKELDNKKDISKNENKKPQDKKKNIPEKLSNP